MASHLRFGCSSGPSQPLLFRRGFADSPFVPDGGVTRSSRPSARYRSRGLPPSRARRAAAASATATTIRPCTLLLLNARRADAASATSLITCCRRCATRDLCAASRVPPEITWAGPANSTLIAISSDSPTTNLRGTLRSSPPCMTTVIAPMLMPTPHGQPIRGRREWCCGRARALRTGGLQTVAAQHRGIAATCGNARIRSWISGYHPMHIPHDHATYLLGSAGGCRQLYQDVR